MKAERLKLVFIGIANAIREDLEEETVTVACQFGASWGQTREETEEVLKMSLLKISRILGHPYRPWRKIHAPSGDKTLVQGHWKLCNYPGGDDLPQYGWDNMDGTGFRAYEVSEDISKVTCKKCLRKLHGQQLQDGQTTQETQRR